MHPIRDPFVATIMARIPYVINPFLWGLCGQISRIVPSILLVEWAV